MSPEDADREPSSPRTADRSAWKFYDELQMGFLIRRKRNPRRGGPGGLLFLLDVDVSGCGTSLFLSRLSDSLKTLGGRPQRTMSHEFWLFLVCFYAFGFVNVAAWAPISEKCRGPLWDSPDGCSTTVAVGERRTEHFKNILSLNSRGRRGRQDDLDRVYFLTSTEGLTKLSLCIVWVEPKHFVPMFYSCANNVIFNISV